MASFSAAAAGALAVGTLYVDGRLQISKDLSSIRRVAQGERNFKRAGEFMFGFEMCQMLRKPQLQRAEHRALTCSSSQRGYTGSMKPFGLERASTRGNKSTAASANLCTIFSPKE
jgi:hypothetical protein